ncbi:hypothetical protein COCC4DRAFT_167359 [Bipolaris maydis ATCC 48331]|uniref:Acyltransferase 3 domain-containing protein n=2 Tax=Cochliobolus heterostrophus TaxID=5016 RepID=M2T0C9_COCH5|nr:uncharacterized protein COCC4DRAFT_167359 [Bipolaris maydis ATCC 48331]EMD91060.1 hypothetical protein COCHEDRAFT_1137448 [Bipolaris maydis C5]KAH7560175.1 hypothetical protein BM1_03809 [Bipolaris maydis]ENI05857.1 hypothetical protein COCC4DRAFT_167359 [Bipolaris maydis ATCC 48331]KAJ5022778.1 hypothetical protein J3E73DRAFT_385005 [Bipolaris maydis]KAJ5064543.1 hypothetical protein J3E74DRAFT_263225 [Bipolaris maydis]
MKSGLLSSPLTMFASSSSPYATGIAMNQNYLIGLRGLFVVQSFLFVFFQTFLPAAVPDSKNVDGPSYQIGLRKSFSVIFCNPSLIYGWIIFLSARTICLPYLANKTREVGASSVFRRGVRLWIPTFVAYSIAAAAFSTTSTDYISDFMESTGNISTGVPMRIRNFLVYFNSMFEIFWINKQYSNQAANNIFPSGTLWIVSVLFQQSYTVYMTMVIVPNTRMSWRVKAMLAFIVTGFWVQSWAWYSITGLLIADAVLNMNFAVRSQRGFSLGKSTIPFWPIYALMVFVGVFLHFLFISWRADLRNDEIYSHTGIYTGGLLNENVDLDLPMARIDNYLIILGCTLLIETFEMPRSILSGSFFVALGRRSFSFFLVQSIIIYTVGIKTYQHMAASGTANGVNGLVCFLVCAPLVTVLAELFYRIVDLPSIVAARGFWAFMTQ